MKYDNGTELTTYAVSWFWSLLPVFENHFKKRRKPKNKQKNKKNTKTSCFSYFSLTVNAIAITRKKNHDSPMNFMLAYMISF